MKKYKNPFLKNTSTDKSLIIKNQNLKDAVNYHQNGQLEQAESKYRQVLEFDPRKHRLKHGIRIPKGTYEDSFKGKGFKLG